MDATQSPDLKTYSETEAAAILGLKPTTLQSWRWMRKGPQHLKIGRRVRYLAADLAEWMAEQRRGGESGCRK